MLPGLASGAPLVVDGDAKTPARGEIWAFRLPDHGEQSFIKRIVGLPGDRLEMRGDALVVNGKPVPSCAVGAFALVDGSDKPEGRLVLEKNDAAAYLIFLDDAGTSAASGPWLTKPGEVFLMGDNRSHSHDSRFWAGGAGAGAPEELLLGRIDPVPPSLPEGAAELGPVFAKCKAELGVP
jgi:signal peptidase I